MSRFRIPRSRRLSMDVLHWHRKVPICPHDRVFDLSSVAAARAACSERIGWPVLFLKGYALAAQKHPEFRQCLLRFPWLHGFENPHSVAMVVMERLWRDERWLFWARFRSPETTSLRDIQQQMHRYKTEDPKKVFRQAWQLSALPTLFRRMLWWWNLNISGKKRAKRAGTFFLTTLSAKGVEIQNPPAFHTGNITYGPLDDESRSRVTLSYDHRLIDGSLVADFLIALEATLNNELTDELLDVGESRKAA